MCLPETDEPAPRRERILDAVNTAASKFFYYDRKEDSELEVGEIEDAIREGEISIEEILKEFREAGGF